MLVLLLGCAEEPFAPDPVDEGPPAIELGTLSPARKATFVPLHDGDDVALSQGHLCSRFGFDVALAVRGADWNTLDWSITSSGTLNTTVGAATPNMGTGEPWLATAFLCAFDAPPVPSWPATCPLVEGDLHLTADVLEAATDTRWQTEVSVVVGSAGDQDEDGVIDECDNCGFANNPDQQDSDGDDVGDPCDRCPGVDDYDSDGDGELDVDCWA